AGDFFVLTERGHRLRLAGRPRDAVPAYLAAARRAPTRGLQAEARANLALALRGSARYQEALAQVSGALRDSGVGREDARRAVRAAGRSLARAAQCVSAALAHVDAEAEINVRVNDNTRLAGYR
ncbi:MAG: hypothetical protein AAB368_07180, partial [bacterium]